MACSPLLLWAGLLALTASYSQAHLCMITPRQRGDMDISEAGSDTCFRHGAECGGEPPQIPPTTVLNGGRPVFFKWQQNYNHYNFGFPGYMDIAFAVNRTDANGSTLGPFTILAVVPDPNEYDQANQRNYTAVVTLPNIDCEHCVIRARYAAHKPGETTFYQCADVKVKATKHARSVRELGELQLLDTAQRSSAPPTGEPVDTGKAGETRLRRALALIASSANNFHGKLRSSEVFQNSLRAPAVIAKATPTLYGMTDNPEDPSRSVYYKIDSMTGNMTEVGKLDFRVDSAAETARLSRPNGGLYNSSISFVPDGVCSYDPTIGATAMPLNFGGNRDAFPNSVIEIDTATGKTLSTNPVRGLSKTAAASAFSAVLAESQGSFITFSLEPAAKEGAFDLVVGRLLSTGLWQRLLRSDQSEDLYVNFQWAEYDVDTQTLYALIGNENDADHLSARLYTFSLAQGVDGPRMTRVELDVSQFTFMSFHINKQKSNHLWAISPGLHNTTYPAFYLVDVNAVVGSVQLVAQLTPPGIFERYYGGAVLTGGPGATNRQLTRVLRVADTRADVIMTVDTHQGLASFSAVSNLRGVRNLIQV